ncbi:hypothetical protein BJ742DRAFT_864489 [Cladochytrium replicatum]|nr:hypothetical protein BJ742DRAFT_864489 [Cladochytrium replicatum]
MTSALQTIAQTHREALENKRVSAEESAQKAEKQHTKQLLALDGTFPKAESGKITSTTNGRYTTPELDAQKGKALGQKRVDLLRAGENEVQLREKLQKDVAEAVARKETEMKAKVECALWSCAPELSKKFKTN